MPWEGAHIGIYRLFADGREVSRIEELRLKELPELQTLAKNEGTMFIVSPAGQLPRLASGASTPVGDHPVGAA